MILLLVECQNWACTVKEVSSEVLTTIGLCFFLWLAYKLAIFVLKDD